MFDIEAELKKLPAVPGVYIMHDKKDTIIYVGKAISLKNRVRQYFQSSRPHTPKIQRMVAQVDYFEYIITDSELEALVLECNLIKEHRPKYNTMLKDDKGYPYIKVTVQEAFPRVLLARKVQEPEKGQKAKYFGPFIGAVKDKIELLQRIYCIRTCNRNLPRDIGKERPCLRYHIKQCQAPCQGYISEDAYREKVTQVIAFLDGNDKPVLNMLEEKMQKASQNMEFEEAAMWRDTIQEVKRLTQSQKITDANDTENRDIIAYAKAGAEAVVQIFFIRGGKLLGREHFFLNEVEHDTGSDILTAFIKQYYAGTPYIPREIIAQTVIEEAQLLEEWLMVKKGQKVHIRVPKRGDKEKLVELAARNASLVLQQDSEKIKRELSRTKGATNELAKLLGMKEIHRIESYDISNISGFESVGSMVVYEEGKPKNSDYRKFRIKSVQGANDYASMEEVLTRRFLHGLEEEKKWKENPELDSFTKYPDLILMDGGKGQVNVAEQVLVTLRREHGFDRPIIVCGMVKDDRHRTRGLYFENQELPIDTHGEMFRLITRIQDETHRFAIEFHRSLRGKAQVHSILDDITGIGPARRKALMRHYSSLEDIKTASVQELSAVPVMTETAAKQVYEFFHQKENNADSNAGK